MLVRDSLPRIIGKSLAIAGTYEPKVARDASQALPRSDRGAAASRDNLRAIRACSRSKVARDTRSDLSTISSTSRCKFLHLRAEASQ